MLNRLHPSPLLPAVPALPALMIALMVVLGAGLAAGMLIYLSSGATEVRAPTQPVASERTGAPLLATAPEDRT